MRTWNNYGSQESGTSRNSKAFRMPISAHLINNITNATGSHRHHRRNVTFVDPHFRLGLITEDPDDNKFVDCAFAANAEYLVSDDKHFRILQRTPFPQLNLVKMAEFLEIIKTE